MSPPPHPLGRLKENRRLWDILIRSGVRVGITPHNWLLLETMSRPWWLYRSRGRLAPSAIERRAPAAVTEADVALCARLITAFATATSPDRAEWRTRGLWAWMFDAYHRELADPLERGDASELARVLASMFTRRITRGLTTDFASSRSWLGSRILSIRSLDRLLSLAEAVGAVPVEGPEQRHGGLVFDGDAAELIARIDETLAVRVDCPPVGAPFGITADGHLITFDTPEQIYAAARLDQAIDAHLPGHEEISLRVVEIGAGYGGMCYWFMRMRPATARYTIIDLPIMNVLHGYFLAQTLGSMRVSFFGEPQAQISVLPNSALAEVEAPFAVLANKDSMPEMPYDAMAEYLEWGSENCDGLFYSYNHETGPRFMGHTEGIPETIQRLGGFNRIRRDHSWLRRGYVEEIYMSLAAGGRRPHAGGAERTPAWRTRSRASA